MVDELRLQPHEVPQRALHPPPAHIESPVNSETMVDLLVSDTDFQSLIGVHLVLKEPPSRSVRMCSRRELSIDTFRHGCN